MLDSLFADAVAVAIARTCSPPTDAIDTFLIVFRATPEFVLTANDRFTAGRMKDLIPTRGRRPSADRNANMFLEQIIEEE